MNHIDNDLPTNISQNLSWESEVLYALTTNEIFVYALTMNEIVVSQMNSLL